MSPDNEKSTKVSVAFLLNDVTDVYESFCLRILGSLLVDGPTSLFYQALIESGLGFCVFYPSLLFI
jgi:Zn-dependent M16 (insulinase) family peptidase